MRRIHKILLFLFSLAVLLTILTGCASVSAVMKSNLYGLPYWYYNPQMGTSRGYTGLVGTGTANTERQARLLACTDLVAKLSDMVGYDLGQEAYREVSVLGTLSQFGLSIIDESTTTQDGQYLVLLHFSINNSLLEQATTEERKRRSELADGVQALVLEGDEYVKAGKEIKAVSNYMKAMALGYGFEYIDDEYSFSELEAVVTGILSRISMSIVSSRPSAASCTVALSRKGLFVYSAVSSAEIVASYDAVDPRGFTYRDYFVYVTNSSGQFTFRSINDSIARTGQITFKLDLETELASLEAVAGVERISSLRNLIEAKAIVFDYSKVFSMGSIAVSVIEHDELGYVTGNTVTTDYLVQKLKAEGALSTAFYSEFDDEDDILFEFQNGPARQDCLMVIRVGLVDSIQSREGLFCVNVEGLVTLYDVKTSMMLYQSDVLYSNAFADDYDEALTWAFRNLSDLAHSLVKAVYV